MSYIRTGEGFFIEKRLRRCICYSFDKSLLDGRFIQSPARYFVKVSTFVKQFPIKASQMVLCNKPSGALS